MLREQGKVPEAIVLMEQLVVAHPDNDRYHFTLGALYDEDKQRDKGIEHMRRAIELNPDNAPALNYLGYTYAEQGTNLDEAESLIRRALAISPNDGFYLDSLGWVAYQRGDYATSIQYLERAVVLAGDDPTISEHLGDAYLKAGRQGDALRIYRDALSRATDSDQSQRLRGKIDDLQRRLARERPEMRRAAIAVLATAVALAGCSLRPAPGPPAPAGALVDAPAIVAADAARRAALRSLRAWARLAYESPDESHKAKQLLVAERPDRLRLEIFSPFGAVFVLAAADGALAAYDRGAATVYRGAANADNLRRYTQMDLPVAGAVDLLLGTPPIDDAAPGVVSLDGGAVELWRGTADGGARVVWYSPALLPLRYEEQDRDGRVRLRAAYDGYTTVDGVPVATQLQIELPPSQQRIGVTLSDIEVNPALDDAVFALQTPAGSAVVDLDRGAP